MMTHWYKITLRLGTIFLLMTCLVGCKENVVYQRSLTELNEKAQVLLASGDVDGAVSRLEAAHDLQPQEPKTTYNLAIAYQTQGSYDKAIPLLESLLQEPSLDKAEVQKALGITYQAKADKIFGQIKEAEASPKQESQKLALIKTEAATAYQAAIQNYESVLPQEKDQDALQSQITLLKSRIDQLNGQSTNPTTASNP